MTEAGEVQLAAISLDCADPSRLADFYSQLLDGRELWRTEDSIGVHVEGAVLVMQRVAEFVPPQWPGSSIVHLDFSAQPSLSRAVDKAVSLGAKATGFQPDDRWKVLVDPAGHPFCLTTIVPPAEAARRSE